MVDFLKEGEMAALDAPKAAAFAVAGAVSHNRCSMTNINWIVDGPRLETKLGIR